MNPFRRIWTRELGLNFTALALLAQILMAVGHIGMVQAASVEAAFCRVDHEPMPSMGPGASCPLCQLPVAIDLPPPDATLVAPIAWVAVEYAAPFAPIVAFGARIVPPARGPPLPV
jgi:hypothetical protein